MTSDAPAPRGRSATFQAALSRYRAFPRWARVAVAVATVAVISTPAVVYGVTFSPGTPADKVSDSGPAHPFVLPSVADPNATVSLASFLGRPVVLNFWGSWCAPCQQELPLLVAAAGREKGKIAFVGVDLEDTRTAAQGMLRRYSVGYPSAFDPNDTLAAPFGVVGSPTTVFIDARGHVVGRVQGALTESRLQWWLSHLS